MRELITSDIFKMSKILNKIDIKIEADEKSQTQLGAEIILQLGENLYLVEDEVNEFLGSVFGMSKKEFAGLPIPKTIEYMKKFKEIEGINEFFKLAGKQNKK